MLKTINSLNEYEKLYNDYVICRNIRGYTNLFINQVNLPEYIAIGKVKYEIINNTLFIVIDEGDFYRLYFCGLTNYVKKIPSLKKDICCDVYEQKKSDANIKFVHDFLLQNGFKCQQKYEQVRLFYGFLNKISALYLEKNNKKLSKNSMTIKTVNISDKEYAEELIEKYMGKYNKLSIEDECWNEQVKNNNIVGVYVHEKLIAIYYYTSKAGRIIVDSNYRGKNLSVLLRMYFASQKRWENSTKNQYDWVGVDNISSKKAFAKLLAIYTGKIKYRYVNSLNNSEKLE